MGDTSTGPWGGLSSWIDWGVIRCLAFSFTQNDTTRFGAVDQGTFGKLVVG